MKIKSIFTLLAGLWLSLSHAQDWAPFPYNQVCHYVPEGETGAIQISTYVQDSTHADSLFFNRRYYNPAMGMCAAAISEEMMYISGWSQLHYRALAWRQVGDSLLTGDPSYSEFLFLPKASVGQSWTVNAWGLTMTCTSVKIDTFGGIIDSIKIFSLAPGTAYLYPPGVSDRTFRLSKHHGLWKFLPAGVMMTRPDFFWGVFPNQLTIIGIEKEGKIEGIQPPDLMQSYAVQPGDLLQYEEQETDRMAGINRAAWMVDSIIQVAFSAAGITVMADRRTLTRNITGSSPAGYDTVYYTHSTSGKQTFYGKEFSKNVFKFYYVKYINSYHPWAVGMNHGMFLEYLPTSDTSFVAYLSYSGIYQINPAQCSLASMTDVGFLHAYDSRLGFIFSSEGGTFAGDGITKKLVGYRLNNTTWGSVLLPAEDTRRSSLAIGPNPVTTFLQITGCSDGSPLEWQIFSTDGRLAACGTTTNGRIDTGHLLPGLYFLRTGQQTGRFVKE